MLDSSIITRHSRKGRQQKSLAYKYRLYAPFSPKPATSRRLHIATMFAPLWFLRGKEPVRSKVSQKHPIILDDVEKRQFSFRFFRDGTFWNEQVWSLPRPGDKDKTSIFNPPGHYHMSSDEYFHITSGAGRWHLWDREIYAKKGDQILVPKRKWHCFEADPDCNEPLIIHVYYDESQAEMEERFFRTVLPYMADCYHQGIEMSIFQLMVIFIHYDMPPGLRMVPWEGINLWLNVVLMYLFGGIGYLMGYRKTYPEYFCAETKTK